MDGFASFRGRIGWDTHPLLEIWGNQMRYSIGAFAIVIGIAACLLAPQASAQVVLPPGNAAVDGDASVARPLDIAAQTTQFVYGTALLGGLNVGDQINGLQFRLDASVPTGPATPVSFTDYEITLSQSLNAPGSLSPLFANNIAGDAVVVRSGALNIAANSFPGGASPNTFGPVITFSSAYTYTGGPLLITIRHSGNGVTGFTLDAQSMVDGENVSASGQNATTSEGSFRGVVVVNLTVGAAAPEPGSLLLVLGCMGGAGILRASRLRK